MSVTTAMIVEVLAAIGWIGGTSGAPLEALRPAAGGVVVTPTLGGPTPVVTPIPGGIGDPTGPLPGGPIDLTGVALVIIAAAAAIGLARGVRREFVSAFVIAASYVVYERLWSLVASIGNKLWRLVRFAVFERGILADDPTVAWQAVQSGHNPLPATGGGIWQLGFFVMTVVVFGYGGARFVAGGPPAVKSLTHLPNVLERIVGSVIGAVAGIMISHFALPRAVPGAVISLTGTRSLIREHVGDFGPALVFAVIVILILYGVSGIGGSGPKRKVYN